MTTASPPPLPPINQRKRDGHDRINLALIPYCRLMGGFKRNLGYERRRGKTVKLETLTGSIFSILLRYFILSLSYFIFWSPILIIFTTHTNTPPQDGAKTSYRPILLPNEEKVFSGNPLVKISAIWLVDFT